MAGLTPLYDRVVIQRVEETKTAGGIIIPDTAKEKPVQGKVLAVGEGAWNEDGDARLKPTVKVGDSVLFTKWGGNEFTVDGKELVILKESDILAILDKKSSAKAA